MAWYRANGRDLPWRRTRDPYAVWVSEIMCQQTTIAAVLPYYARWMDRFATVEDLAIASEDEVLSLWQGLGYYSRGRNLWRGARQVVDTGWPKSYSEWLDVPGVGAYTAAAVSSICLGEDVAVVDGNVERVFTRVCIDDSVGELRRKGAQRWAESVLLGGSAGDWNQAVMELGGLVCRPMSPDCSGCPVSGFCSAYGQGRVGEFPVKAPKKARVELFHVVWVPVFEGTVGVRRVPEGKWWQGMWEFPRDETLTVLEDLVGSGEVRPLGRFSHVVTQHKISVDVFLVECDGASEGLRWVERGEIEELAMPSPMRTVLRMFDRKRSF